MPISSLVDFAWADNVLSSAKLKIIALEMKKNKSFIDMLDKMGPTIDPCGTPEIRSFY